MKRLYLGRICTAVVAALTALTAYADINLSYYTSLHGKCGAELKTAVFVLVNKNVTMLDYGSGANKTWGGFYECDRGSNGEVIDRYSSDVRYFGTKGQAVSGMNIEHSFPKSWWGGTNNNAYKDLYNLMPCESNINSTKSNYPMGKVVSKDNGNGFTKVGCGTDSQYYWEPADQWKGDFARGYMYMATAYQNLKWSSATPERALLILENNTYPTLKEEAAKLFIEWARQDPVTADEVTRNDIVETLQGNRNPFNDFPNLMEYIWGDSISTPFNIYTTVKGGATTGGSPDDDNPTTGYETRELYANTFMGDSGNCTIEIAVKPAKPANVWINTSDYGWKATAYSGGNNASDESLVLPEVDLTEAAAADISFSHAANYISAGNVTDYLKVMVRTEEGTETDITDKLSWPTGRGWTFVDNEEVSLDDFTGHKIRIVFRYTSTTDVAGTWEIKNVCIRGKFNTSSGIENVVAPDADNSKCPIEYYNIYGIRINPDGYHGVVIRRQGSSVTKMILE